ncbi:MAG: hypothetical protein JW864_00380 [Spirochaetes bacterium]|nr:hypothetical protein [Spirochaetota bacterium]
MSLINDLKHSFLRAGKVIVDKTGDYSRIARLSLDNKKYESDIDKKETETGKLVFEYMRKGDTTLDLKDKNLTDTLVTINELEKKIADNKSEIEQLKKSEQTEKKKDNEEQNKNQES